MSQSTNGNGGPDIVVPRKAMVFEGCFIHSTETTNLVVEKDKVLGVIDGEIVFLEPKSKLPTLLKDFHMGSEDVIRLGKHQFVMPGFIDSHAHASQYSFTGTGNDLELLPWLQKYTYPTERKFESDHKFANDVYEKCVRRTLKCGTTTISYFATIDRVSTMKLVDTVDRLGQRAFIGKVNMDSNSPDDYRETLTESLSETKRFITDAIGKKSSLATPCITPRFAVTCSMGLMTGLAELAQQYSLPIQTHVSENRDEIAFVKKLFPSNSSYTDVYDEAGLLGPKTILAHGVHLTDKELNMIKLKNSGISHCPNSNLSLSSGVLDIRKVLDMGIKLGLGTDFAGGTSCSMIDAIRRGVDAANVVAERLRSEGKTPKPVTYKDLFKLATLGSAQVMGLDKIIGNFQVGKYFDALVVDPCVESSPFDVFATDDADDILQKFLFQGDDRNISSVYVAGKKFVP